jgi:hypothetical protein
MSCSQVEHAAENRGHFSETLTPSAAVRSGSKCKITHTQKQQQETPLHTQHPTSILKPKRLQQAAAAPQQQHAHDLVIRPLSTHQKRCAWVHIASQRTHKAVGNWVSTSSAPWHSTNVPAHTYSSTNSSTSTVSQLPIPSSHQCLFAGTH